MVRQIFLDIETNGLDPKNGSRLIEVACVEVIDEKKSGRIIHFYVNDDPGISNAVGFTDIADELADFIHGSELVAHNAPFDLSFLDHEYALMGKSGASGIVSGVVDTLDLAKTLRPDDENTLDALLSAFDIRSDENATSTLLNATLLVAVFDRLQNLRVNILGSARCMKPVA